MSQTIIIDQGRVGLETVDLGVLAGLSQREREIAALVATGASNKQIARQLRISIKTVKNILTKIFRKTRTSSRTQLAVHLLRVPRGEPSVDTQRT